MKRTAINLNQTNEPTTSELTDKSKHQPLLDRSGEEQVVVEGGGRSRVLSPDFMFCLSCQWEVSFSHRDIQGLSTGAYQLFSSN